MDDTIKRIERTAHLQAKKAARMWTECRQLLEAGVDGNRMAVITAAMELNHRAIEQARESLNRFEFVRRYRSSPQAHSNRSKEYLPVYNRGPSAPKRPPET